MTPWKLISSTQIGSSHIKSGTVCQDAHLINNSHRDQLLIAVSDGAGTAKRSDEGSNRAVKAALKSIEQALGCLDPESLDEHHCKKIIKEAFKAAEADIIGHASASGVSVREFAATLTVVFSVGKWFAAGQIGDGAVVAEYDDGRLTAVMKPQHGEYANETNFLTTANLDEQVEMLVDARQVFSVVAMTDGMIRLALNMKTNLPYEPFFRPLIDLAKSERSVGDGSARLDEFLASERVMARTDDDKTLVVAVRSGSQVLS